MQVYLTSDLHRGFSKNTVKVHRKFFEGMAKDYESDSRSVSALILAGDLISHRQKQLPGLFRQIRECLPDLPVYLVWGNHDFWERERYRKDFESMLKWREEWCAKYNMVDLNYGPRTLGDVTFYGFTGWYANPHVRTNDSYHLVDPGISKPSPLMKWLGDVSYRAFIDILAAREKQLDGKAVLVTHFPPMLGDVSMEVLARWGNYGAPKSFFDPMADRFDAVLYGHTHMAWCGPVGTRKAIFVNSGSDYDAPRYVKVTI